MFFRRVNFFLVISLKDHQSFLLLHPPIQLAQDQRTFTWGSNGRKLMTVPFDEHPYSAMAAFFKTDEGLEIYRSIEKKFS